MKTKKKVFKVLLVVGLVILAGKFTGILQFVPVTVFAKSRLHAMNDSLFQTQVNRVEAADADLDRKIEDANKLIEVHDRRNEKIDGAPKPQPPPLPPVVVRPPVVTQPVVLPGQTVANLMDFAVLKDGSADGVWEFQLDARQPWKALPGIIVSDGDQVEFSASGLVCGLNVSCSGPNGQQAPARTSTIRPDEFPFGDGWFQALVGQIGTQKFQVGDAKTYTIPDDTGSQSIQLMDNYRMPASEISRATGGFRVKITIRKKA